MDILIKGLTSLYVLSFCILSMLFKPLTGSGQMKLNPFKFELEERFSPINEQLLQDEISEIVAAQKAMKKDVWSVKYWNSAYPAYRWHQLLMQASRNHTGHKNGGRVAIMHLSIYDAVVETWKHKQEHYQKAAYQ